MRGNECRSTVSAHDLEAPWTRRPRRRRAARRLPRPHAVARRGDRRRAGPHRPAGPARSTRSASSTRPAALTAARASEDRWARGEPCGALDGVPVSIKDLLLTRGWPTLRGSHSIDPAGPWDVDAPAVARIREHGGVLVGKTTTPELGLEGRHRRAAHRGHAATRGTRAHLGRLVGRQRGAVALGMAPLTLGTDGGGSVRIPAGFCGITTLKPTWGRVPIYPASPFGVLSHVGPMTRSVADAALLLDVVSGPTRATPGRSPRTAPTVRALEAPVAGLRVAASADPRLRRRRPRRGGGVRGGRRRAGDAGGARRGGRPGVRRPDRRVRDAVVRGRRGVAGHAARARAGRGWTAGWWTWRPRARGSTPSPT